MKKHIISALAALLTAPLFVSCLEEAMPTDSTIQQQIENEEGKEGLVNGIAYYLNLYSSSYSYDIGFGGFMIWRDAATGDVPIYDPAYDYFSYVGRAEYLGGNWQTQYTVWQRYYSLIKKCNLVLATVDRNSSADAAFTATALAYRADAYMQASEWYEYKLTGYAELDDKAQSSGILGLTIPIVTENTTEQESRNNPRVPFYEMFRFILTDLNEGVDCVTGTAEPSSKIYAGKGVIYGLLARLWLTIGTRFDRYPEDLAAAMSHESDDSIPWDKFGVTTANECFEKAAQYARLSINAGYTPYTESQWFDPKTGFNTPNNSWMWADIIASDNDLASSTDWQSWPSFMSPETEYGVSNTTYCAYRMIDASLYNLIGDSDWRKPTWINPDDAGKLAAYESTYARGTNLDYDTWAQVPGYVSFKFHPGSGDCSTSTIGNTISLPLMRVEEMYLIEAEAVGRSQGVAAGRALLETFVNSYRYNDGSYTSTGSGLDGFITDVFNQKRIEFWGEGLIMYDYRRLGKAVTKGYSGTNFPEGYRYNSLPGYVAPWSTFSIPLSEHNYNPAVTLNPDPSHSTIYSEWEE